MSATGFRLLVYLGPQAVSYHIEFGLALVEILQASRHTLSAMLLCPGDALLPYLRAANVNVLELPPQLCQAQSRIRASFADPAFAPCWQAWTEKLRALAPDLGLVFYGYWLPPPLYRLLRRGFINFHPAPLPRLRGYEPETFAILEDWESISGTFHAVDEDFDCGNIVWRTDTCAILPWHRPSDILRQLSWAALTSLPEFLDALYQDRIIPEKQDGIHASQATVQRAIAESYICWPEDDVHKIHLRQRAFNYQENFFCLKAEIEGRIYRVHEILLIDHYRHAPPATVLGHYPQHGLFQHQPIIQACDGSVVLRLSEVSLSPEQVVQIRTIRQEQALFASPTKV
jgi:methionyl-tRNA formyltransferase